MSITKEQRSLGMHYDYDDHTPVTDAEYVKLMKADWDARSNSGKVELYINNQEGATKKEIRETGLVHFENTFLPTFNENNKVTKPVVLEYGCGIGRMTWHIKKVASKLLAVDISKENIKKCVAGLPKRNNVKAMVVSGMDLSPVEDSSVDYIFSTMVFQHIGSETVISNILEEMNRVLKEDGVMHLQFRDMPIPDNNIAGNTWHGAQIGAEFIEKFFNLHEYTNLKCEGHGTESFWVTLIK